MIGKRVASLLTITIALALSFLVVSCGSRDDSAGIRLSGNIEATEVRISFKIPGRLIERRFDEGQWARKGDIVGRLDDADLRHAVSLARANLQAAQANLRELLAGARPQEINEAESAVQQAKADMENKGRELRRAETLYESGATSRKTRDDAQTAYTIAQEAHRTVRERYALVKEGPRREDIDAGRARVAVADAALKVAQTNLGHSTVRSPISGVVLSKASEPGEVLAAGRPVLTIGGIEQVWLRVYVDERDLGKVRWGQEATVTTDSYPNKVYRGRVSFISSEAEFTPKTVQTEKERVTLVYRIKVDLDNKDRELKPGMIADCIIKTGPQE